MRRERRNSLSGEDNGKKILYWTGSILGIAVIVFVCSFMAYSNKLKEENSSLNSEKISSLMPSNTTNTVTEEANSKIGKDVNEMKNEIAANETNSINNIENTTNKTSENKTVENKTVENKTTTNTTKTKKKEETKKENKEEEKEQKEVTFIKPVEGEISKEFAKDNLSYSNTLKEWTTHLGVDIKADKASVVKAASDGTVKSIKNDPRYGLTIVMEHESGYTTVYSNLLSTEFVVVGEKVKQGQSIATVGTSATFEIADETHLHFEILKDNVNIDPATCMK